MPYCSNCGAEISATHKFCFECGTKIEPRGICGSEAAETSLERKLSIDGIIHKCPHCGASIKPTDAICDSCGHHIASRTVCSPAEDFSRRIMEIEMSRQTDSSIGSVIKGLFDMKTGGVDEQKLLLIKTFPIPNTVEDISEFMFMAASNVDVSRSKRGLLGNPKGVSGIALEMSEAWVSKMKQMYQKAKMAFSDDPEFAQIDAIYKETMSELNLSYE